MGVVVATTCSPCIFMLHQLNFKICKQGHIACNELKTVGDWYGGVHGWVNYLLNLGTMLQGVVCKLCMQLGCPSWQLHLTQLTLLTWLAYTS
eukprot:jgi/Chrzof1/12576/UNPLg00529.t1